ncbi:MAG TPA: hypothetical protein VGC05_11580 [Mycobacterium sp.]
MRDLDNGLAADTARPVGLSRAFANTSEKRGTAPLWHVHQRVGELAGGIAGSSPDPFGDMRRVRVAANKAARERLGGDLCRPLPTDLELQYRSLMGPLADDPSALMPLY